VPHGFCIFYHRDAKELRFGAYKGGQECGLQRIIKSGPADACFFKEYKAISGLIVGPVFTESADGAVQSRNEARRDDERRHSTKPPVLQNSKAGSATSLHPQMRLAKQIATLQAVEAEVAQKDRYVDYCVKKFKHFKYATDVFESEAELGRVTFKSCYTVPDGVYKDHAFWGHHLSTERQFVPHGLCVLIDRKASQMQLGTFKFGREQGQQRVVKSKPEAQRSFMQYTSEAGVLHGQALIERADATVEAGAYEKNKQHGVWRVRLANGQATMKTYENGVAIASNTPEQRASGVSSMSGPHANAVSPPTSPDAYPLGSGAGQPGILSPKK
jgi:hypothetical protein